MNSKFKNLLKSRTVQGFLVFLTLSGVYSTSLAVHTGSENLGLDILCKWDCGWYKAIIRNGYISSIPPVAQLEDIANVAFFPLYPSIARMVGFFLGIKSDVALPLTSVFFALGFFLILPTLVRDVLGRTDWKRIALMAAYPSTFYMWVGYGESVYCFFLVLALLSFEMKSGWGSICALFSGVFIGLSRLTGFVLAGAVAGIRLVQWEFLDRRKENFPFRVIFWMVGTLIGAGSFFLFCHLKFGVWNIYFQTLDIGWHKEFSISGFLNLFANVLQNHLSSLWHARDPVKMSWMINVDLILVYAYILFLEFRKLWRAPDPARSSRLALLIGGFIHLLITTIGDSGAWHQWMNGMRYSMPAFFLLVILWDSAWIPGWLESRPSLKRVLYFSLLAFWIPFQIYYLYLFSRQAWVS